jgi:hypothetical protein
MTDSRDSQTNLPETTCHHQSKRIVGRLRWRVPNECVDFVRNNARINNPMMSAMLRHSNHGRFHYRAPNGFVDIAHPNAKINRMMPRHRIGRFHYRILSESDDIVRPNARIVSILRTRETRETQNKMTRTILLNKWNEKFFSSMNKINLSFLLKHFHYFYKIYFLFDSLYVVEDIRTVNSTTALPARYVRAVATIPVASYP